MPTATLNTGQVANVKAHGALGDNSHDDTANIQAAIDAIGAGGTVVFPPGTYKITAALNVGETTAFNHIIRGPGWMGGGNGTAPAARIVQYTLSAHIFNVIQTSGQGNSLTIEGLEMQYNGTGTGTASGIFTNPGGWTGGLLVRNCNIQGARYGAYIDHIVSPTFENTTFLACGTGCRLNGEVNLPTFENVWFQACTNEGLLNTSLTYDLRMTSCIVEATSAGPGIRNGVGTLRGAHFDSTWFEFPTGGPHIQVDDQLAGLAGHTWKFTNCYFDSSGIGVGHDVIYISKATPASFVFLNGVTFESCFFGGLAGSNITRTAATITTGSADPGFSGLSFIDCQSNGPLGGVHLFQTGGPPVIFIGNHGPSPSDLLPSFAGLTPEYTYLGSRNVNTQGTFALAAMQNGPTITSNQDNWNPTDVGIGQPSTVFASIRFGTDASRDITGLVGGAPGRVVTLMNSGANNAILKHDVTSTAANRFLCPESADYVLTPNSMAILIYDSVSSRWRVK